MIKRISAGTAAAVFATVGAIWFAACGPKASPLVPNAPAWVNKGSGAFSDAGKSVFYGVGSVTNVQNLSLVRDAALASCQAEIAKQLNTYIANLNKQYMESLSANGRAPAPAEQQMISNTLKAFTEATVHGVMQQDAYMDRPDKTYFVLCRMSMSDFMSAMNNANQIDSQFQAFVRANAQKAFDDLSKEENRRLGTAAGGNLAPTNMVPTPAPAPAPAGQ